ncbi:PilZ domain-containing protein [Sphingobium ummariense]|uniref:PilZ domain-containing protein n=1 Tax=Sphingobium ummariense RL-3 TaxID=1346791 RepID=T0IVA8_9SPHN|nr:PilZ domain-containing protein [Sphingobium ummariense]EQB32765.1 hypothetical protein M529_07970 [Sphingobium ummariense RL-3]
MTIQRSHERTAVDIPIVVTTVLDSLEGTIIDLSEGGAQVVGCSLPPKSQCQIDLEGYSVFGIVRWSEHDRMGIRFPYELSEGPLFERLEIARAARRAPMAFQSRTFHSLPAGGFGRRIS